MGNKGCYVIKSDLDYSVSANARNKKYHLKKKREIVCETGILIFSQTTNFRLPNSKEFADDNFKFVELAESFPNRKKTLWEKEKLLVSVISRDFYCRHVKTRACLGKS